MTILGIAVGIGSIVFLVSLGYGLQELSINKIASIEAINTLDISPGKNSVQKLNQETVDNIKKIPDISKLSPLLALAAKIEFEGKRTDSISNLVDDSYSSLEGITPVVGSFFSNSPDSTVISTALAKSLGIEPTDAVKKQVNCNILILNPETKGKKDIVRKFNIVGVIQDDSTSFAFMPISSVASELDANVVYNSLKAKVDDQSKIATVRDQITAMGFTVTSIADTIGQVQSTFKIIQIILAFFGFVALMVASIGMFNTMTIALLERTRDIGIMKSLGIRDRDISRMFLAESTLIATLGGGIGVFIGWFTGIIINYLVNLLARSAGGEPQTLFVLPLVFAAGIIGFSVFVGIATGFYPSRRASKLNPLDALRYE